MADLEVCLDLINSLELDRAPQEHLLTPDDGVAYFTIRGLAHEDGAAGAGGESGRSVARRGCATCARPFARSGTRPSRGAPCDPSALATLNRVLAHTPHAELHAALAGVVVGHRHDAADPPARRWPASPRRSWRRSPRVRRHRFRICANEDCRWVFEDTSRGGRRRWCDMTSCGNQAKVRRFRAKRAAGGADGEPESAAGPEAG